MDTITIETINEWQNQVKANRNKLKQMAFGSFLAKRIKTKFKGIESDKANKLIQSLCNNYFSKFSKTYLDSDRFKGDLIDQLINRLQNNRVFIIPSIDSSKRLKNTCILEIGCGTGSSTVALAEQGAKVTAIDIDDNSIIVAKERCVLYGLHADFLVQDAARINKNNFSSRFDIIIYYVTLEHLTNSERLFPHIHRAFFQENIDTILEK